MNLREIKFRAWNKEKKYMGSPMPLEIIVLDAAENPDKPKENWKNLEIMELTGLKDMNGREISELDIVKDIEWDSIGVIHFNEGSFKMTSGSSNGVEIGRMNREKLEIIGNIYENPELLTTQP